MDKLLKCTLKEMAERPVRHIRDNIKPFLAVGAVFVWMVVIGPLLGLLVFEPMRIIFLQPSGGVSSFFYAGEGMMVTTVVLLIVFIGGMLIASLVGALLELVDYIRTIHISLWDVVLTLVCIVLSVLTGYELVNFILTNSVTKTPTDPYSFWMYILLSSMMMFAIYVAIIYGTKDYYADAKRVCMERYEANVQKCEEYNKINPRR